MSLLGVILEGIFHGGLAGSERRRDQLLLREGRARCGIRAVRGRVLDIGTEWSVGTCTISAGRIRFTPRIGIVGDRDVEVLEVLTDDAAVPSVARGLEAELGLGGVVISTIRTAGRPAVGASRRHRGGSGRELARRMR